MSFTPDASATWIVMPPKWFVVCCCRTIDSPHAGPIARRPLREVLKSEVFQPLGMKSASLGLGGRAISQTMRCQVEQPSDWDWNSPYWRDFGSPWGGALAAAADIAIKAPGGTTKEIQEAHLALYHTFCALIEARFFPELR